MNKKLKKYIANINGVVHTTFNPKGPGVVRIHLIPPKKIKFGIPWVVIINGHYYLKYLLIILIKHMVKL